MNLPDVNFWIAISFGSHVHHGSAKAWMQQAGKQSCCLCRVTQMGFLRLITNPKVLRSDVQPVSNDFAPMIAVLATSAHPRDNCPPNGSWH
jgi:predicted nucleic acid-binding protein